MSSPLEYNNKNSEGEENIILNDRSIPNPKRIKLSDQFNVETTIKVKSCVNSNSDVGDSSLEDKVI